MSTEPKAPSIDAVRKYAEGSIERLTNGDASFNAADFLATVAEVDAPASAE